MTSADFEICEFHIEEIQRILEIEILHLATTEAEQRFGYATVLLEYVLNILVTNEIKKVYLEIANDNYTALALYQKFSFEQTGIRSAYYQRTNGWCDAVTMKKVLL